MQEGAGGHIHSDLCYVTDYSAEPVCGTEKSEGHTHDQETCYDESGELVCELEETAAHIHDGGCYPNKLDCGMDEGDGARTRTRAIARGTFLPAARMMFICITTLKNAICIQ